MSAERTISLVSKKKKKKTRKDVRNTRFAIFRELTRLGSGSPNPRAPK
jgi:hypothetical protein